MKQTQTVIGLSMEKINELSGRIIGLAIKVHKALGAGFVEKIY
ncbi:MAG: hypothetical protein JW983_09835 [Elusimicrobia bacterium]|nr:hypothetical protein [Elusimicrobiota bacterium]